MEFRKDVAETKKFNSLFNKVNVNMGKETYKELLNWLYENHGMITKCTDPNEPSVVVGYAVRIESDIYKDVVYNSYTESISNNKYFDMSVAILQAIKKGNRYVANLIKNNKKIIETKFDDNLFHLNEIDMIGNNLKTVKYISTVKNFMDNYFCEDVDDFMINSNGVVMDPELIEYLYNFENKTMRYYKGNKDNKIFISLPF